MSAQSNLKDAQMKADLQAAEEESVGRQVATKAALMSMPFITFPDEYGFIVGVNKSAAYLHPKRFNDFPPTSLIGDKRFMRTEALLTWMRSKEEKSQQLPLPEELKKRKTQTENDQPV
jgi:hypothetical protein